jgi:hypothetical protein
MIYLYTFTAPHSHTITLTHHHHHHHHRHHHHYHHHHHTHTPSHSHTTTTHPPTQVPLLTLDAPSLGGSAVGGYFSDNGFLALPGRPTTVTFTAWAGKMPSVATWFEELEVVSAARGLQVQKFHT